MAVFQPPYSFALLYLLFLGIAIAGAPAAPSIPPPPRMLLLDAAHSGRDIVVVGERGAVYRSTDQATSWQPAPSGTRATLTGVSFAPAESAAIGWAVGHDAIILGTIDAGRTWTKQFQGELQDSFLDVLAIDARRAIAVGAYGLFATTADAGAAWQVRKISDSDSHLNRISRGPTGTLYLAGERGTLLRSTDHGATWVPLSTGYEGSFYGVLPLGERSLLAYGLVGHVYRSEDDGATWTQVRSPAAVLLATAARISDHQLLLAGYARTLLVSRDAGRSLVAHPDPLVTAIAELLPLGDNRVLAVGETGVSVLTSTNP